MFAQIGAHVKMANLIPVALYLEKHFQPDTPAPENKLYLAEKNVAIGVSYGCNLTNPNIL
jgi:hypothetical protein